MPSRCADHLLSDAAMLYSKGSKHQPELVPHCEVLRSSSNKAADARLRMCCAGALLPSLYPCRRMTGWSSTAPGSLLMLTSASPAQRMPAHPQNKVQGSCRAGLPL